MSGGIAGGRETLERIPNVCMLGPGAVLGGGLFLTYFDSMLLRARTDVRIIRFDTQVSYIESASSIIELGCTICSSLRKGAGFLREQDFCHAIQ